MGKIKLPYSLAKEIADNIVYILNKSGAVSRCEIAGSIRREKSMVGDVEIVCVPSQNILGGNQLEMVDLEKLLEGVLIKNGEKLKQLELDAGIGLDLFIVTPPAEWGFIFTLRTGDQDFSHAVVTIKQHKGLLPSWAQCKDGSVRNRQTGEKYPTPEESDFFQLIGLKVIPPKFRNKDVLSSIYQWRLK